MKGSHPIHTIRSMLFFRRQLLVVFEQTDISFKNARGEKNLPAFSKIAMPHAAFASFLVNFSYYVPTGSFKKGVMFPR